MTKFQQLDELTQFVHVLTVVVGGGALVGWIARQVRLLAGRADIDQMEYLDQVEYLDRRYGAADLSAERPASAQQDAFPQDVPCWAPLR